MKEALGFDYDQFEVDGIGFDYEDQVFDFTDGNNSFDERPSNWFNRTTLDKWTTDGVYSNDPVIIKTIHFKTFGGNSEQIIETRVRISDPMKINLLARSYVKYKLNMI